MKKLLVLIFAMLFLGVGIASATDFTITGSYYARGTWSDNWDGTGLDNAKDSSYGVYDHEMILDTNWQISPYTKVFARFEVRDEDWADASNATEGSTDKASQSNIVNEYIYGQHTFANGFTVRTGLMGTSSWGTDFGNDGTEAYRVMLIKTTGIGQVIVFTEKGQQNGFIGSEWQETDNDADTFFAGLVTKAGDVVLMPSLVYVDVEFGNYELMKFDFAANGTIGNIGFEAEFIYSDYEYEAAAGDYDVFGVYANVWTQLNAFKIGALIAHGSYDEDVDKGFTFGDDFAAGGAMIMGDEAFMFANPSSFGFGANALVAATLYAAYGSYAVNEKLTVGVYLGYADSNVDNAGTNWDGASIWEANVTGAYKITDNVTYSVGAATLELEYGNAQTDPDSAIEIFHKLAFSF